MKKNLFLLSLVCFCQIAFAQKQKVNSAWNYLKYEEYDKAKAAIDEASENEDSKTLWKTWYYRGLIYQAIHEKKMDVQLNTGDALNKAFEAYKKSLELDPKHDFASEAIGNIDKVRSEYSNMAFEAYSAKDFAKAYDAFKMRMAIYDCLKKYVPNMSTDTSTIYNAGLLADKVEKYNDAIGYYEQLAQLKYREAYGLLAADYCRVKDTTKAIATLESGAAVYSGDVNIIYGFVNIFSASGKFEKAIDKINDAIKLAPTNEMLYIVKGNAYEHIEKNTEAEQSYLAAYNMNPKNYDALKALALNIYNQGAILHNAANKENDDKKSADLKKKSEDTFARALDFLEKAHAAKADDEEVAKPLSRTKSILGK